MLRVNYRPIGTAAVVAASLLCGACAGTGELALGGPKSTITGSTGSTRVAQAPAPVDNASELDKAITYWGKRSAENPGDAKAVLNFVRNLVAADRKQQALTVLQQASIYHGGNREFAGEYGRLALSLGQVSLAEHLLKAADSETEPDWKIVAALGTATAKQGKYEAAVPYFKRALQLKPGEKTLLNNLAMALAANGRAAEAEQLLRQAAGASTPGDKIHKNLALVLSLQGKDAEAQQVMAGHASLRGIQPVEKITRSGWTTKFAEVR
jgi:Flp pilus assembly protein TadD